MNRQQIIDELSYQANVLNTLEQLVVDHENNVNYYEDKKSGLSLHALKNIFIVIAVFTLVIGTILKWNLILFFILLAIIFVIGYFSVMIAKHRNSNKNIALENNSYEQDYQNALSALDNHPRFDLPEGRYYSYYLAKLSEMISTGQANSLGEAINTLENRLTQIKSASIIADSVDQNTAAINNLNNNMQLAANQIVEALNANTNATNFLAHVNASSSIITNANLSKVNNGLAQLNRKL